jgi:hypothetical protein
MVHFDPEDEVGMYLRNINKYIHVETKLILFEININKIVHKPYLITN